MAHIPYPDTTDPSVHLMPAPLNVFRMMSHAPALTGPTVGLGRAILGSGALPPRLREQVIMLVAAHAALSAARELLTTYTWSPPTVASLRVTHTDPQIVELALTVGYYTMLAGLMNGLEIDIDPLGSRFTELANCRRN